MAQYSSQHRAVDFRDFLDEIDLQADPGLDVHVIFDNLSAHKAPAVQHWLLAHPRFALHFTPTCASWISQVERWFAELQRRCLDRGMYCSLDDSAAPARRALRTGTGQPGRGPARSTIQCGAAGVRNSPGPAVTWRDRCRRRLIASRNRVWCHQWMSSTDVIV
jgi:DDE superfamily endonuclease